jgi:probable rRNA maturation factor
MNGNNDVSVAWTNISAPQWLNGVEELCQAILDKAGISKWELSLVFCDDAYIRELNARYRNMDAPTDVLSFSMAEGGCPADIPQGNAPYRVAGDIVISLETLERNARQDAIPVNTELKRLLIHGVLHLNGMDHTETDTAMIELQEQILAGLNKEEN